MRWLVRESRLPSVLGCEELKLTGRSMNLKAEMAATGLHLQHRTVIPQQMNPPGASFRSHNSTI